MPVLDVSHQEPVGRPEVADYIRVAGVAEPTSTAAGRADKPPRHRDHRRPRRRHQRLRGRSIASQPRLQTHLPGTSPTHHRDI